MTVLYFIFKGEPVIFLVLQPLPFPTLSCLPWYFSTQVRCVTEISAEIYFVIYSSKCNSTDISENKLHCLRTNSKPMVAPNILKMFRYLVVQDSVFFCKAQKILNYVAYLLKRKPLHRICKSSKKVWVD